MGLSKASQTNQKRRQQLQRLDQLCDTYEGLCESQSPPDLQSFLSENDDQLTDEIVEELIRIDLNHQMDNGTSIEIDDYAKQLGAHQSLAYRVFNSDDHDELQTSSLRVRQKTYEVLERIGAGGMAQIYRGFDHRLNRPVAIKMLRSDFGSNHIAIERFENEAKLMAALRHDGIVHVYDVSIRKGALMIVFELMEGGTLREKITEQPLAIRQCAEDARTIAAIIHEAHEIGIIHLDLKPSNILLTQSGKLKVGDFGLAMLVDQSRSSDFAGEVFGTVNYMAPEQAGGQSHVIDRRTDVYGIGAVLYELLTGRPPFEGESNRATIKKLIYHETTPPRKLRRDLPYDLDRICMRCLSKNPVDRYQSAKAIEDDLTAFLEGRPTAANPPNPVGRLWRWTSRNVAVTATALTAFVLIGVILVTLISRIIDERDRFREQRDAAVANLYTSLVGEARAIRLAGGNGFRVRAFEKIRQAIELDAPNTNRLELRNEIVASMGQFLGQEPAVWKSSGMQGMFVASAIHPDGAVIAMGRFDGSILIKQIEDGREIQKLEGHRSGVFEIVFSPRGNRMASVDDLGEIRLWTKNEQGQWVFNSLFVSQPTARPQYVKSHSLAFSKDGQSLFSCPFGGNEVERWELDTNEPEVLKAEKEFESNAAIIRFSVSSDSELIAMGTIENTVLLWNRSTQKIERTITLNNARQLLDVVISPDKQMLAVGTLNGVHVFNLSTGEPMMSLPGDHLITLSFSPDSQVLALPSEDLNLVRLWDMRSRRELAILENDAYEASFSADGSHLVCISAGQVAIWNLRESSPPVQFAALEKGVNNLLFSPDGQLFSSDANGNFSVYEMRDVAPRHEFRMPSMISSCYFQSDLAIFTNETHLEFYQLPFNEKSKPVFRLAHDLGPHIDSAKITEDGKYLAAAGTKGIKVWSIAVDASGEETNVSTDVEKLVFDKQAGSLIASDDSQLIAWVDVGGNVNAWNLEKQTAVLFPAFNGNIPDCLSFLPDTHTLISADVYGVVRKLDLIQKSNPEVVATSEQVDAEWQTVRTALSPNGHYLCVQRGRQISVWDLKNDVELVTLPETQGLAWSIAWDLNSSQIALGDANGNVVVWQLNAINDQLQALGLGWK